MDDVLLFTIKIPKKYLVKYVMNGQRRVELFFKQHCLDCASIRGNVEEKIKWQHEYTKTYNYDNHIVNQIKVIL